MYASKGKEEYWNIFFSVNFYLQEYIAVFDGFFFFENLMLCLTMHFVWNVGALHIVISGPRVRQDAVSCDRKKRKQFSCYRAVGFFFLSWT